MKRSGWASSNLPSGSSCRPRRRGRRCRRAGRRAPPGPAVGLPGSRSLALFPGRHLCRRGSRSGGSSRRPRASPRRRGGHVRHPVPRSRWPGRTSGLPCLPGWSSTSFAPLPFFVRATIIVGRSLIGRRRRRRPRSPARHGRRSRACSSPPPRRGRRRSASSQPCIVSPVWPSRLTSISAVRLARPCLPACSTASRSIPRPSRVAAEDPDARGHPLHPRARWRRRRRSAGPGRASRWRRRPRAGSGWGGLRAATPSSRKVSSSSSSIAPAAFSTE